MLGLQAAQTPVAAGFGPGAAVRQARGGRECPAGAHASRTCAMSWSRAGTALRTAHGGRLCRRPSGSEANQSRDPISLRKRTSVSPDKTREFHSYLGSNRNGLWASWGQGACRLRLYAQGQAGAQLQQVPKEYFCHRTKLELASLTRTVTPF